MNMELQKRLLTSFFLLSLLILMFFYTYILIISLILITIISWIEFYALISNIFRKNDQKNRVFRFICKALSLIYLSALVYFVLLAKTTNDETEIVIAYSILISVLSDIGGLVIGKIFKGRKLTKISPKKTISGSIGSFVFSLSLLPFFIELLPNIDLIIFIVVTLLISFTSQMGDLFISYLKRKAKVKDTSDILPGHGGLLDRIDGMIFAIPIGFILFNLF